MFNITGTNRLRFVFLAILFLPAAMAAAVTSDSKQPAITAPGDMTIRNNGHGDWSGNIGFQFTVGTKNVIVTSLGIYDALGNKKTPDKGEAGDGLEQPAVVTIYQVGVRVKVAQAIVPAGDKGMLQGDYRYAKLKSPVLLRSGVQYRIVVGVSKGGNGFRARETGKTMPATSAAFSNYQAYFIHKGGATRPAFPTGLQYGAVYSGPNFLYHLANKKQVAASADTTMVQTAQDFEHFNVGKMPSGWSIQPRPDHGHAIQVATPGASQSIHGLRLNQDWKLRDISERPSLTYTLPKPVERISITFDLKWSNVQINHHSFSLFTTAANSSAPSQVNMYIRRNLFWQFGGIRAGNSHLGFAGEKAGHKGGTSHWYRLRLVAGQHSSGIAVWISQPDQTALPSKPTAVLPASAFGKPIASVHFGVGDLYANCAWIDNVVIQTGMGLPKPPSVPVNPNLKDHYPLWLGKTFPRTFGQIPYPKGLKFHIISNGKKPWRWCHGASIAWHKGKLYATWAVNPYRENTPGEMVLGSHSSDGGKTWSKPIVVAPGDGHGGKTYSNSHGVLLENDGTLWGFFQHWKGGWDNPLAIEAFTLNDKTGKWESKGIVARKGWPIDPPQHLANGNWAIGLSGFKMWKPAVAISHGSDFLHWDTVAIPIPGKSRFPETSLIAYGNHLLSITRRGGRWAWVANSKDGGRTWTKAQASNYPNLANPSSGILSTGQWFLIGNMNTRNDLEIGVGKPGQHGLSKVYRIRYGSPPAPPYTYQGTTFPGSYSYPSYVEHDGKLYVVYSVGKYDIELAVIPISSLKAD